MKHWFALILLLAAALLAMPVFAENADFVKSVFDALTAKGSSYTESKALYDELFPGLECEENLKDDGFSITFRGSVYMAGSWDFTREGDYLTLTINSDDYIGYAMVSFARKAVADCCGMNEALLNAYLAGLGALRLENPWFLSETDYAAGTTKLSIYAAGPYDMKELDQMALSGEVLSSYGVSPLDAEVISKTVNFGKLSMVISGSAESVTILLGEYGRLDGLAFRSLKAAVKYLKPAGWEAFEAEYAELADTETAAYSVSLEAEEEAVGALCPEPFEGYGYALIRFGPSGS